MPRAADTYYDGFTERQTCNLYKSLAEEMKNTGAVYEDKEVIESNGNFATSRQPSDLPRLCGRP